MERINTYFSGYAPGTESGVSYQIMPGDTLYLIAKKYNVSIEALMQANSGINPYDLQVGSVIFIPGIVPMSPNAAIPEIIPAPKTIPTPRPAPSLTPYPPSIPCPSPMPCAPDITCTSPVSPEFFVTPSPMPEFFSQAQVFAPNLNESPATSAQYCQSEQSPVAMTSTEPTAESAPSQMAIPAPMPAGIPETVTIPTPDVIHSTQASEPLPTPVPMPVSTAAQETAQAPASTISPDPEVTCANPEDIQSTKKVQKPGEPHTHIPENPIQNKNVSTYTVKRDDSLTKILMACNYSFATLRYCNPDVDLCQLRPGQQILIPEKDYYSRPKSNTTYTTMRNDNLSRVAESFNVSTDSLLAGNPALRPKDFAMSGTRICIPDPVSNKR